MNSRSIAIMFPYSASLIWAGCVKGIVSATTSTTKACALKYATMVPWGSSPLGTRSQKSGAGASEGCIARSQAEHTWKSSPMNGDPSARMQNTKERPTNASTRSGALPAPPRDLVRDLAAAARRAACFALGGISGGGGAGRTDSGFEPGLTAAGRRLPVARPRAMRFVSQPARDGGRCCCAGHSVLASVSEAPDGKRGSGKAVGSQGECGRTHEYF